METDPSSSLHGKRYVYTGFTFLKHPTQRKSYLQIVIYKEINPILNAYVICLSEGWPSILRDL